MPPEIDTKATAHALLKELHEEENSTSPRAATLHDQAFAGKWKQLSVDQRKAVEAEMKKQEEGFQTVYPNSKVTFNDANGEVDISVKGKTHAAFHDGAAAAPTTRPTDSGAAQKEAAAKEAARLQQEQAEAAKKDQQRLEDTSKDLLTKLHNNNKQGFSDEYEALSPKDKAAVAKLMKAENQDPSTRITLNPADGTLASIMKPNGVIGYITPGEFENVARDPKAAKSLSDYYNALPFDERKKFNDALESQAGEHGVHIKYDKNGNPEIHDAGTEKKLWPESKLNGILHGIEKPMNIPH